MPVKVDPEICDGCRACVEICPLDALRMDEEEHPYMKYDECWYCGCCEEACPKDALKMLIPYPIA